jgi:tRNA-dihydrouridine synthase A
MLKNKDKTFAVAPMMEWTDRHCRFFHRTLTQRARLYSEMITAEAVLHGDRQRLLGYDRSEHPLAGQLGGSNRQLLTEAARILADLGYDEINLNCGCPSDRVREGAFGACLMRQPDRVADIVLAMKVAVSVPVTVKCRIGVDDQDPEESLFTFAHKLASAQVDALIVHARKAWLNGLSPKENRDVPPLDYPLVYRLKHCLPNLPISLNGGIKNTAEVRRHLAILDGVMVGRAAYKHPALLLAADPDIFGQPAPVASCAAAIEAMLPYISARLAEGIALHNMTRHLLGFFSGMPGARAYRRHLATFGANRTAGLSVLLEAVSMLDAPCCDQRRLRLGAPSRRLEVASNS